MSDLNYKPSKDGLYFFSAPKTVNLYERIGDS